MKLTTDPADPKSIRNKAQLSANDSLNMMNASKASRRKSSQVSQQKASGQLGMECKKSSFFFSRFRDSFHDRLRNLSSPFFVN
jgi:hypothetical protein